MSTSLPSQLPGDPDLGEEKSASAVKAQAGFDQTRACNPKDEQRKTGLIPKNFMVKLSLEVSILEERKKEESDEERST